MGFGIAKVKIGWLFMKDEEKTKEELIAEIRTLRQEINEIRSEEGEKVKTPFCELRDLFDDANDLIFSVDTQGQFLYVNKKWHEMLGYAEEELKGVDIFDIVHPDSQEDFRDLFQKAVSGGVVGIIEMDFISKDGRRVAVEGHVNCRYEDGRPMALRAIFRDITKRKEEETKQIIKGGSEHLKVAELIQICNFFVPGDSAVTVTNPAGKTGQVYIGGGRILHAITGKLSGKKALFRMLGWEAGVYTINKRGLDGSPTIDEPLEQCLIDGARELDEFIHLRKNTEKESRFFEIEYSDDLMKKDYDPVTAEVLSLAITHKDLDMIIDGCKYTDLETLKAVIGLLKKGIIKAL